MLITYLYDNIEILHILYREAGFYMGKKGMHISAFTFSAAHPSIAIEMMVYGDTNNLYYDNRGDKFYIGNYLKNYHKEMIEL